MTTLNSSDWYLYENGQVKGPLSSGDLLQKNPLNSQGVFVSKQGFSRWYPFSELSSMIASTDRINSGSRHELQQLAELTSSVLQKFQPNTPSFTRPSVESHLVQMTIANHGTHEVAPPAFEQLRGPAAQPASPFKPPLFDSQRTAQNQVRIEGERLKLPDQSPSYKFFMMHSKLRLGKRRNLFLVPFVFLPLSLGFYWYFWFRSALRDVCWHVDGNHRNPLGVPVFLVMFPVVHLILIYGLATQVQRMEQQNQYATINPLLATFLGFFPPFAMIYMQRALNKHWLLHLQSASDKI